MKLSFEILITLGMAVAGYYIKKLDTHFAQVDSALATVQTSMEVQTQFNRQVTLQIEKMDSRIGSVEKNQNTAMVDIAVLKGKND